MVYHDLSCGLGTISQDIETEILRRGKISKTNQVTK